MCTGNVYQERLTRNHSEISNSSHPPAWMKLLIRRTRSQSQCGPGSQVHQAETEFGYKMSVNEGLWMKMKEVHRDQSA